MTKEQIEKNKKEVYEMYGDNKENGFFYGMLVIVPLSIIFWLIIIVLIIKCLRLITSIGLQ